MSASAVIGSLSVFLGLNSAAFSGGLKKAGSDIDAFKGMAVKAFGLIAGALSVGALANYADRWSDLTSRLSNATGSAGAGANALDRLQKVARQSYSSIEQTANAFLDQSTSLNALGISSQKQLDLTEALNNTLVISATRGDRAASVLDSWGKAMALGALRGDELNNIITKAPRLAQALADGLGVSVVELRKMGEQGKITRDVMLGITDQLGALREEAGDMPATIGDGFLLISDAVFQFVGRMDQAFKVSENVAGVFVQIADIITASTVPAINLMRIAVGFASEHLELLVHIAGTFIAIKLVLFLASVAGAFITLAKTMRAAGIVATLFTKITRAKIIALILLASAIAKVTGAYDHLVGWMQTFSEQVMASLPEGLRNGIDNLGDAIAGLTVDIEGVDAAASESLATYMRGSQEAAASVGNIGKAAKSAGKETKDALKAAADEAKSLAGQVSDAFKGFGNDIKGLIDGTSSWNDVLMNVLNTVAKVAFSQIKFGGIGNGDGSNGIFGDVVGGFLGGLFGFKDGGSFKVGGHGGIDNQVVAFKASPDETVSVMTPAQRREAGEGGAAGKIINIQNTMTVQTPDARSFKASEAQTLGRLALMTQRGARAI